MDSRLMLTVIIGMALVTYIPRLVPALALSSRQLNPALVRWLGYIPTAVLSGLLAPALFMNDGGLNISMDNVFLLAAVPVGIVAWRFGGMFLAALTGMGLVAALRYFGIGI